MNLNPEYRLMMLQQESRLQYYNVRDFQDSLAQMVSQLSIYFHEVDLDKIWDMPFSRAQELVADIQKHHEEIRRKQQW
jgi:hypothetical protein